ncbi:MAG: FISUMP domain-containing protein [Bacteroidales bacterium]|jgi:uncharacterized protein (TIGR02145 family)
MKILTALSCITMAASCLSCEKVATPIVKTVSYEVITLESVLLTGEVIDGTGGAIKKRGFCWGTDPNPRLTDHSSENGSGPGVFSETISNLTFGKSYFFKSYATDSIGTYFGEILSIKVELKPVFGTLTDSRDGNVYPTVKINNQTWMAKNLAYLPAVSPSTHSSDYATYPYYYVYDFQDDSVTAAKATGNYNTYGVLYNWAAAQVACPTGWHLPSEGEWTILLDYLGSTAVTLLEESGNSHWDIIGGTNLSGFTVLPGGQRMPIRIYGEFDLLGHCAYFWSSSENNPSLAQAFSMCYSGLALRWGSFERQYGLSVRCLLN